MHNFHFPIGLLFRRRAGALLLAIGAAAAPARAAPPAYDMEADVSRVRDLFHVPGIAIAVVKDGRVLAARGFGVRELGAAAPVDGRTLFDIAANSKAFTAAMLAGLVDEGKLSWDDPVTKHLPQYQLYDAYATRETTIRDLLSNRSGLGVGAGDLMWWPSSTFSADEIIHNLRHIAPATSFRNRYIYEYLPYIVAAKIVALKTGKPWGEAVRERILAPLGMTRTTTSLAESAGLDDRAAPHSVVDGKLAAIKPMAMANAAGAMGISTSAEDIAKWMTVLLESGKLDGPDARGPERRLFSAAQAREMWSAQTPIRVAEPKPQLAATKANFAASGLGFELRDYRGVKLVTHGGWQFGFYSAVVLVPSAKLGIAIMTNGESTPTMNALKYRLLDQYLGLAPTDWIAAVAEVAAEAGAKEAAPAAVPAPVPTRAPASAPSLALSAYDGEYRDAWYGAATIEAVGAKHILRFAKTPDMTGELTHFRHDTFIVRWKERSLNADAYVTFSLNPDGSVERMKMAAISDDTDTSFDFGDLTFLPVKPVQAK